MAEFSFIRFERSGGFTGMTMVLARESLDEESVEQIRGLMEETGLQAMHAGMKTERQGPDEFTYTLVYMTEEVEQTLVLREPDVPESLRPLIHFLTQRARHATRH